MATVGSGLIFRRQPRLPSQESWIPGLSNFWGSPVYNYVYTLERRTMLIVICLKSFPSHGCITVPNFVSFKRYERRNLDVRREVKNVFPNPFAGRGYSHFNGFQTCLQLTDYANSVLIRQQPFIILYTNTDTDTGGTENVHFLRSFCVSHRR